MTLYRYGILAWVWRALIAGGLAMAAGFFALFVASWNPLLLLGSAALAGPALFFGRVLAVRADLDDAGTLQVHTLLFQKRRIARGRLGPPKVRRMYQDLPMNFNAPRVWVPVKGEWPIYFDLLAQIPDTQAFHKAIGLNAAMLRHAK